MLMTELEGNWLQGVGARDRSLTKLGAWHIKRVPGQIPGPIYFKPTPRLQMQAAFSHAFMF